MFTFAVLLGIRLRIKIFATGLKTCAIAAEMKKYKLIIRKRKRSMIKIALLAKPKLNSIKILIFIS